MRSWAWSVALWASVSTCGAEGLGLLAPTPNHTDPRTMYFAGGDLWHAGGFLHGGLLWSPSGLFHEGFTLKLLAGAGTYRYRAGGIGGTEVTGVMTLASVMPGWRFKADRFEATVYAGLDLQHHHLTPDDPGNSLKGTHVGVRGGFDLWYEPLSNLMLAANSSLSTIGPSYWARLAGGWRVLDRLWIGPEAQVLGAPTHHEIRLGVHVTALKIRSFEWAFGFGFAVDTDRRNGLYGRVGILARR